MVSVVRSQYLQTVSYPASDFKKFQLKYPKTGETVVFEIPAYKKLFLFVFLSPECPLSQQYTLSLNELSKTQNRSVSVIGIFPGKSYDRKTITRFLDKYRIAFATFIDETKSLTNYLSATVTPEVILLSSEEPGKVNVQYRGAIDDRVKELGVKRLKAGNFFLKDAVEQCLENKEVVIKRTDPVGCLINDY
jgi:hypothetical protein